MKNNTIFSTIFYVEEDEHNEDSESEQIENSEDEPETDIEKEFKIFTEAVLKQINKTAEVAQIPSARIKDITNFTMNFKDGSTWTYDVTLQKKERYREVITAKQALPIVDELSEDESDQSFKEPPKEFSEEKPVEKKKTGKKPKKKDKKVKTDKIVAQPEIEIPKTPEVTPASKPFKINAFSKNVKKSTEIDTKSTQSLDISKQSSNNTQLATTTTSAIVQNDNQFNSSSNSSSNLRGQDAVLRGILPLYSSVGMVPPSAGEIQIPTSLGYTMSLRWELGVTSNLELTN